MTERLLGAMVSICVNRLDPPLQVSHMTIKSPSIVRLHLKFDQAEGRGYAWTLAESDALELQNRLNELLQPRTGQPLDDAFLDWLTTREPDPDLTVQRVRAAIDIALIDAGQSEALARRHPKVDDGRVPREVSFKRQESNPRIYASDLYDSQPLDEIVALARSYVAAGFSGLKMRIGRRDAVWARERLHAVRAAIQPNTTLMVDGVQGWDDPFCHAMMPDLVDARVTWLEDPFAPDAYESFRALVGWSPIDICTGESCRSLEQVRSVIETGVHTVMLDIQHLGGIGATLQAMRLVTDADRELTFHVFTDISASLAAGCKVGWLEWAPLWGACLSPPSLSPPVPSC